MLICILTSHWYITTTSKDLFCFNYFALTLHTTFILTSHPSQLARLFWFVVFSKKAHGDKLIICELRLGIDTSLFTRHRAGRRRETGIQSHKKCSQGKIKGKKANYCQRTVASIFKQNVSKPLQKCLTYDYRLFLLPRDHLWLNVCVLYV